MAMTSAKLNKLISTMRAQGVVYFRGSLNGEEVELRLEDLPKEEQPIQPQPPKSREDILREFEVDLF